MNYREVFDSLQSRYHLEEILLHLSFHPNEFDEVFGLALGPDEKKSWRILWAVEKISQRHPEWFDAGKIDRITNMVLSTKHQGIHRIGLSILNSFPAPDPLNIDMLNALYEWMLIPSYSIGVQSLAMKLLYKYALTDEDLLREFIITLEQADDNDYTMAFVSSRRNILRKHR